MQINIICKMHEIDANFLMSKPMGEDFDKDTPHLELSYLVKRFQIAK